MQHSNQYRLYFVLMLSIMLTFRSFDSCENVITYAEICEKSHFKRPVPMLSYK